MIKKKLAVISAITAVSCCIVLVLSGLFVFGQVQYTPRQNDFSIYEFAVNPSEDIDYYYPLANYAVVRNGNQVDIFETMGIADFETGIEYQMSETTISHQDAYSHLTVHETLTTVIEFTALEDNALKFDLDSGTGALRSGDAILIGNEDASGVLVFDDSVVSSISAGTVTFDVPAGSSVIFRADPSWDKMIGSAVAGGQVAAEMYLTDNGWTLVEDVVAFDDVIVQTVSASKKEVTVALSGSTDSGKTVVLHVDDVYLDYNSADEISVQLGDEKIKVGKDMSDTLWETGPKAKYFAVKTAEGFDVVVYIPEYSGQSITIWSAERDIGIDGLATMLAAIGIVGVAVLALVRKD